MPREEVRGERERRRERRGPKSVSADRRSDCVMTTAKRRGKEAEGERELCIGSKLHRSAIVAAAAAIARLA